MLLNNPVGVDVYQTVACTVLLMTVHAVVHSRSRVSSSPILYLTHSGQDENIGVLLEVLVAGHHPRSHEGL